MTKLKKNNTDLNILFHELDLALDKADFKRSEDLCDELINMTKEIQSQYEKEEMEKDLIKQ